ncbi:MAG TPA: hypothetical protein VJR89_39110, partial [Polyangiales bacterium]|nr:hypothetical protein [Polyangiales bacterium]
PIAAFMLFAARSAPAQLWPAWVAVIGNAAWVLASVLLVVDGPESLTKLGSAFVIAQAVVVAVAAELEYVGLRKITQRSAAHAQ